MADYTVTAKINGKPTTLCMPLPIVTVNAAQRSPDPGLRKRLATNIWYRWRQQLNDKAVNGGVPFTYEQLTVTRTTQPKKLLSLFDD